MENNTTANPSQQPLVSQSSPHFSKTFIIILVVILTMIVGVGGYILGANQNQIAQNRTQPVPPITQPSPTLIFDETANWKMYASEDTTFSFKFPPEWIYETEKTTLGIQGEKYNAVSIRAGIPFTEEELKAQQEYWGTKDVAKMYNNFSLRYATHTNFKNLNTDNLVEELIKKRASQVDNPKTLILNNNIQAKEVGYGCQAYCIDVLFKNNSTIFDASTGPNAEANISALRQILSTFKFTDQP